MKSPNVSTNTMSSKQVNTPLFFERDDWTVILDLLSPWRVDLEKYCLYFKKSVYSNINMNV